jgi:hypothetical protein
MAHPLQTEMSLLPCSIVLSDRGLLQSPVERQ